MWGNTSTEQLTLLGRIYLKDINGHECHCILYWVLTECALAHPGHPDAGGARSLNISNYVGRRVIFSQASCGGRAVFGAYMFCFCGGAAILPWRVHVAYLHKTFPALSPTRISSPLHHFAHTL